jgi:hypothetical protein
MLVMWGVALALRITSVRICNGGVRFCFTDSSLFGSDLVQPTPPLCAGCRFALSFLLSGGLSVPGVEVMVLVRHRSELWWCRRRFWGGERFCTLLVVVWVAVLFFSSTNRVVIVTVMCSIQTTVICSCCRRCSCSDLVYRWPLVLLGFDYWFFFQICWDLLFSCC